MWYWDEPKTAAEMTCPTCNDPLKGEHGTFCPRCQWSEYNVNLDSDPLSNPPDPTRDMHRGIQSSTGEPVQPCAAEPVQFSATIPSHRWTGKWLQAVESL